jgi:hypothetical protein
MMALTRAKRPLNLTCLLVLTFLASFAQASVLGNGNSVPPTPLFPTGTLLVSTTGTITTPTLNVGFTEWVYADPTNTWCAGCLDFVYQFTNNGPDVNERYSMYNFAVVMIDAGTDPFGVHDPTTIDRSLNGPVVGFDFPASDQVSPGQTTPMLVIETNALHYTTGFVSAQDGTAGYAMGYSPANAVPEPSSLALLGSGLAVAGALMRKMKFVKQ